jgi:alpha-maltose-1-phosphate synthase
MNIGLVCEGDASTSDIAFSGTAKKMFEVLRQQGDAVEPLDASIRGMRRGLAAALSVSVNRGQWRSKFRYGNDIARMRTNSATRFARGKTLDVILQVGATYDPPFCGKLPYALYCDWNMALSIKSARNNGAQAHNLTVNELKNINVQHTRRYREAAAIFTISERLRQSFLDDYQIAPHRVHTAYPGSSFDLCTIKETLSAPRQDPRPTVLFIGKEFHRKGGDILAKAFMSLQKKVPSVRLIIAGNKKTPDEFSGIADIKNLGLLDKSNPSHLRILLNAYREADVLALPSRHDPFPNVIREAMFFGLPCVASDIFAMSEMIVDGETGYLVPPQNADALAMRLELLLLDRELCLRLGHAALKRANYMFTWDRAGKKMHEILLEASSRSQGRPN